MKLISLNIWGGKVFDPLVEFVKRESKDTDIFCFQEVFQAPANTGPLTIGARADIFARLQDILPGFQAYFAKSDEGWDLRGPVSFPLMYGEAVFVRNEFPVRSHRQISIYETASGVPETMLDRPRGMQCVEIDDGKGIPLHVFSLHGLLDSGGKRDTEKRLAQFAFVRKETDAARDRVILCGDFNTNPDTQSIATFEKSMRNLLKDYGMPHTRNSLYADMERHGDYWGDHVFTTPDIKVKDFKVLPDIVSDHMPLMVDFS